MAELTDEQIEFLEHHNVPLERVFDAFGMRTKDYKAAMREEGCWIAYGVTPCQKVGHTLRTRRGDCFQCNPAGLTWTKKQDLPGLVYVAWSESAQLTKVGITDSTRKRIGLLNSEEYGGSNDWRLIKAWESDRAGKVEIAAHQQLETYATTGVYFKSGLITESRELFDCSWEVAVQVVSQIVNPSQRSANNVVSIPKRTNESRYRQLPTAVALHVVHQGLKLVDQEHSGLTDKQTRLVRSLAESILSAITHGMRDQLVNVPEECIDAYMELSALIDSVEDAK